MTDEQHRLEQRAMAVWRQVIPADGWYGVFAWVEEGAPSIYRMRLAAWALYDESVEVVGHASSAVLGVIVDPETGVNFPVPEYDEGDGGAFLGYEHADDRLPDAHWLEQGAARIAYRTRQLEELRRMRVAAHEAAE